MNTSLSKQTHLPEEKEMAISEKDALAIVQAIKAGTDEAGVKTIQTIAEVAQDKIVQYIKELKRKK